MILFFKQNWDLSALQHLIYKKSLKEKKANNKIFFQEKLMNQRQKP